MPWKSERSDDSLTRRCRTQSSQSRLRITICFFLACFWWEPPDWNNRISSCASYIKVHCVGQETTIVCCNGFFSASNTVLSRLLFLLNLDIARVYKMTYQAMEFRGLSAQPFEQKERRHQRVPLMLVNTPPWACGLVEDGMNSSIHGGLRRWDLI